MSLAILQGCGTTTASKPSSPDVVNEFCLIAKPTYWSKDWTDAQIIAAKKNNAKGVSLCGWNPLRKVSPPPEAKRPQ